MRDLGYNLAERKADLGILEISTEHSIKLKIEHKQSHIHQVII
jgi:hypothetical protein